MSEDLVIIPNSRFIFRVYGNSYRALSVATNSKVQELLPLKENDEGEMVVERFEIRYCSLGYKWQADVEVKLDV
jgi:hypothetical protein